jgi:hypothetical protein
VHEFMGTSVCEEAVQSTKGCVASFEHIGLRRGMINPNDETVHESDIWSPYKNTRHTTKKA